jgi:hypothetical protein
VSAAHVDTYQPASVASTMNTPEQATQQVLKAEAETPDATDRDAPANASPVGGPMGAGQPAAAGPILASYVEHVDAVMRAVSAMLRSAPNFDGRIGEVEAAVWAAIDKAVAAERERLRLLVESVRDANAMASGAGDSFHLGTEAQRMAWVRLMDALGA